MIPINSEIIIPLTQHKVPLRRRRKKCSQIINKFTPNEVTLQSLNIGWKHAYCTEHHWENWTVQQNSAFRNRNYDMKNRSIKSWRRSILKWFGRSTEGCGEKVLRKWVKNKENRHGLVYKLSRMKNWEEIKSNNKKERIYFYLNHFRS